MIKCYSYRKSEQINEEEEGHKILETILQNDLNRSTKRPSTKRQVNNNNLNELIIENNELDQLHLNLIKVSLMKHFLFADLSQEIV